MSSGLNNNHAEDEEELLQIEAMFKERLELDATVTSEVCVRDKVYVEKLERELRNCYQEIEYLQDQVNLRNVEANFMGKHIHSLELRLAEGERLHDKLRLISEELVQYESQRLVLIGELKFTEEELQKSALHIEKLETLILDSQCEIESLKLDITSLEQRCFEAETCGQENAQERARITAHLKEVESQFLEAQQEIHCLENENKELHGKLALFERKAEQSLHRVQEQLEKWLKYYGKAGAHMESESDQGLLLKLMNELPLSKEICTSEEFLGLFLSKLAVATACDEHVKDEMKKKSIQIHDSELLVKQLKEELRQEKIKAKEEAEDLTQEMAELRYQIMGMLEEESKRRALIEQASLQRIQDLEAQVQKEQKKTISANMRFQEAHEIAERRAVEVRQLKKALERFHLAENLDTVSRIGSCSYGTSMISPNPSDSLLEASIDGESLDATCTENRSPQALIERCPRKACTSAGGQNINVNENG